MKSAIAGLALLFLAMAPVAPVREHVFHKGTCADGGAWWSVTSLAGGVVVGVSGATCRGETYFSDCRRIDADPAGVAGPEITGERDGNSWSARVYYDPAHKAVGVVGRDCDGKLYREECIDGPPVAKKSMKDRGSRPSTSDRLR